MQTTSRVRIRLIAIVAVTLVSLFAYAAAADYLPLNGETVHDSPIPVEPDGGIGDGAGPLESES